MIKASTMTDEGSTAEGVAKTNIILNWFEELKERVPVD
jgi:hypothetical protein